MVSHQTYSLLELKWTWSLRLWVRIVGHKAVVLYIINIPWKQEYVKVLKTRVEKVFYIKTMEVVSVKKYSIKVIPQYSD